MNAAYVYLQLYRLFDNVGPIDADCGRLCNKACCDGEDAGMYLFPGEKKVYELLGADWAETEASEFSYTFEGRKKNIPILFCNGECDRYVRPLACRIFPLTPILNNEGKIDVIIDPRAKAICPLSKGLELSQYNPDFIKNIRKAFNILASNKEFKVFLKAYTEYISEYLKFFN